MVRPHAQIALALSCLLAACSLTASLDDLDASTGNTGSGGLISSGGSSGATAGTAGSAAMSPGGHPSAGSGGTPQAGAGQAGTAGSPGGAAGKGGAPGGQGGTPTAGGASGGGASGVSGGGASGVSGGGASGASGGGASGSGASGGGASGAGGEPGGQGGAGGGPVQPSCAIPLDCNGQNCCQRATVQAGSFTVGHSTASAAPATVEAFDLDVFEVTVGRFKAFVKSYSSASIPAEGAGAHPKIDGSGWFSAWNTSLPADPTTLQARLDCHSPDSIAPTWNSDDPTRPINCVDWYTAFAFCIWDGGYLPTGVEWEYAAAGGSLLRDYPWGDMPPPDSTLASWGCAGCTLSPVGSFPPGKARWGHLDLAGNAREWSLSWFIKDPKNCPNCQEFGPDGTYKNSRGGGVNSGDPAALLTTTVVPSLAGGLDPSGGWQRFSDIGFRCAYNSK